MRKFFCLLALIVLFLDSFEQQASLSDNLLLQRGHNLSVYGLSFSSDGKYLLSAGIEGDVVLWEVARGIEIKRFSGHKFYIYGVQFCNHDSSFFVRDSKGIIYKWDIARKQIIKVLETNCRGNDVGISADGNYVSAVNFDTVRLYETNNFTLLHVYPHFSKVQLSKKVFLMQNDSSLSVVGYKDLDKPSAGKIPKYTNNIYYVTPDENFIGTNNLGTLNLIKIGDTAWKTKTITDVRNMKFANEGNLLVTIEEKRTEMYSKYSSIGIYSLPDGKEIHFIPSSSEVDVMAVSPNGKFVATVSILGQPYDPIEIWDTKTGRLSFQLKANQAEINNFVYDKHTRSMYTTRAYSTFQKWNPYGGEGVVWSGEEMIDRVSFDMQLNSKGDAIAVTHGNSVSVFSTADGSLITKFAIEAVGYITQVRFWPDDDHIIAANTEHNLQIWSIKTGDEVYAGKTGMEVTSILPVSSTEVTLAGTSNMSAHTIQNFVWNAFEQKLSLKDKNVVYTQVLRACTFNKGFLFSTNETGNYEIPRIFVQNSSHKQTGEITGFESFVHAMAVNSNTLIAGDDSGYIYTVDIGNYKITSKKRYSQHSITGIVFFDDTHKAFAVNAATDRYVSIFSFPSLEPIFTMFDNVYGWLMLNPQGYYFGS
ncbi:MAG: WD40 repeat domain-containing protein, partial [Ferruginibacter sp.]